MYKFKLQKQKEMSRWYGIKPLILILSFILQGICYAQPYDHNILVLHSYHQGLEWTDNISEGIQEVFRDRTDVNIIFEYLDTKRNYSEEYYQKLYELYKVKAKKIPFKAILTSDNAAFEFMLKYRDEFYPCIPVLYCGVNNLDTNAIMKTKLFFGTGEQADHYGTISAIEKIFPKRKNILIINDNTLTGREIKTELDEVLPLFSKNLNFEFESDFTLQSLQDRIAELDDTYAIYLLVINRDINDEFISYEKGISGIKLVSKVPVFGSWDFYQNKGIIGGKITLGEEQGKYIARMAERIIDGESVNSIPKYHFIGSRYVFDYNEMKAFGVSENKLPKGSKVINKPPRIDNKLYTLLIILSAITVFFVLVLLVLTLRLRLKKARELEMAKTIKQRTEELNIKNKELSEIIVAKDKFFSILAHDLRGSVGIFRSYALLLNQDDFEENSDLALIGKNIQIAANQTFGIVEDLLYWGYNQFKENKKISLSSFRISEVLLDIQEKYKLNVSNITFSNHLETDKPIISDKNICAFIFRNIIQNAIKFSHENSIIEIKLATKTDGICISIKDYGIGMSKEIRDSIFSKQPVKRQGLTGQKPMGLGLVTVLDYLKIIDGELEIISEPDKGSEFIISLKDLDHSK